MTTDNVSRRIVLLAQPLEGPRDDVLRLFEIGEHDDVVRRGSEPFWDNERFEPRLRGVAFKTVDAPLPHRVKDDDHEETEQQVQPQDLNDPEDAPRRVDRRRKEREETCQHKRARNLVGPMMRIGNCVQLKLTLLRDRERVYRPLDRGKFLVQVRPVPAPRHRRTRRRARWAIPLKSSHTTLIV